MRLDATGSNIWEVFNTNSETLYSAEFSLVVIQQWISPAMKKKKKKYEQFDMCVMFH